MSQLAILAGNCSLLGDRKKVESDRKTTGGLKGADNKSTSRGYLNLTPRKSSYEELTKTFVSTVTLARTWLGILAHCLEGC